MNADTKNSVKEEGEAGSICVQPSRNELLTDSYIGKRMHEPEISTL